MRGPIFEALRVHPLLATRDVTPQCLRLTCEDFQADCAFLAPIGLLQSDKVDEDF